MAKSISAHRAMIANASNAPAGKRPPLHEEERRHEEQVRAALVAYLRWNTCVMALVARCASPKPKMIEIKTETNSNVDMPARFSALNAALAVTA